MATWRVSTQEKKNIRVTTYYTVGPDAPFAAGKEFQMEEWWRWGYVLVEDNVKPYESDDPYEHPFDTGNWDIVDQDLSDGVSLVFHTEGWTDEEREQLEALWDEYSYEAFEQLDCPFEDDVTTEFFGPLDIEKVE